jgi:mannitol/fructose-specific phosphotransferase system IIA component (Ntr-type)
MQLSKIISPERVKVPLLGTDKRAAITELIDVLAATGALTNRDAALEAVLKREAEKSTGIGYGLGIPHGRTDATQTLAIAAGKPAQPLEFQSIDKRPVTFILLVLSPPNQMAAHIQALGSISKLMTIEGFRNAVAAATTAAELHAAIASHEAGEGT